MFIEEIDNGYILRCASSDEKHLLDAIIAAYKTFDHTYYGEDEECPNHDQDSFEQYLGWLKVKR